MKAIIEKITEYAVQYPVIAVGAACVLILILFVVTIKSVFTGKTHFKRSFFHEGRAEAYDKANERMTKEMGAAVDKLTDAVTQKGEKK